jgi:GTPase SAR1 family protein
LQALKSPTKKTQGTQDAKLTDGIEIKPWVVPVEQDGKQYDITYSCWDFAGQTVYYNTHQVIYYLPYIYARID